MPMTRKDFAAIAAILANTYNSALTTREKTLIGKLTLDIADYCAHAHPEFKKSYFLAAADINKSYVEDVLTP